MKTNSKWILPIAAIAMLAAPSMMASPHFGTDILHYMSSQTMTNTGIEPNAGGTVAAQQETQGHANIQRMNVNVSGLTPSVNYELLAITQSDPNWVDVAEFATDANGNANLNYSSQANGAGHGHGHGPAQSLPDALNPVSQVQQVAIGSIVTNSLLFISTNIVLSADMTNPQKLQYLVKRDIGTNGVSALLQLKATTDKSQFGLRASGLDASSDYQLAFNGGVVQTNTSDANGRLQIKSAPTPAPILSLQSVQLLDSSNNVVVGTTLP